MHGKGDFMVRFKMAVVAAVAGGALAGGLAMPSAASADTTPGRIVNWGSGFCLDVGHYGNLYENGVRIQQWGCGTDSRQVWHLVVTANKDLKNGYMLVNGASGKCLDVTNGKDADRTPVQQWDCRFGHFAPSQTWFLDHRFSCSGNATPSSACLIPLHKGQEELVDDRPDACGLQRLEVHEQVVSHQVERHGEHGRGNALEVDLAAVVGALVDDPDRRELLRVHGLVAGLRGGQAGVGQQP
jgi:hypothetical protein